MGAGRVMPVRDAYTPVVKLHVGSTDVDLLFAPLAAERLPEPLDLMDQQLLEGAPRRAASAGVGACTSNWRGT